MTLEYVRTLSDEEVGRIEVVALAVHANGSAPSVAAAREITAKRHRDSREAFEDIYAHVMKSSISVHSCVSSASEPADSKGSVATGYFLTFRRRDGRFARRPCSRSYWSEMGHTVWEMADSADEAEAAAYDQDENVNTDSEVSQVTADNRERRFEM